MNIFVTGSSGFIGSKFIDLLKYKIKKDDTIFLLVRNLHDSKNNKDKRFKYLIGNLEDLEKHKNIILKCEYIYHIAANATFSSKSNYDETNFYPTKKLVEILKNSHVLKNFIFISTIGAVDRHGKDNCNEPLHSESLPEPKSKYGLSKLKSEECIRSSNLPFTIIRPTWVYGKGMRKNSHINVFIKLVNENNPVTLFDFPGKVSIIHVDDLATSLINCINNNKIIRKTYFAETEEISFGEIFSIIRKRILDNKNYNKNNSNNNSYKNSKHNGFKVPKFKFLFSRIHKVLPIAVNNLFIDYLYAKDDNYKKNLLRTIQTIKISESIDEIIFNHPKVFGYTIITGANSGIGLATARLLNMQGKKLILVDVNTDILLKEFLKEKNSNNSEKHIEKSKHIIIKADLSNTINIENVANKIKKYPIGCLINNVGIGYRKSFDKLSVEEIEKIISVNIYANILLTKYLLEKLKKDESIIVNIASSIAYNPLPNMLMYSATKAFISNWSESLTYELKNTNKVITFSPSGTNTNFQKSSGVKNEDGKKLKTPEYVARKIVESIKKKKTVVILDIKTYILLTISKFLPRKVNIMLWGKLFDNMR
jgi:hypothetical protein